jgi:hypothetical protein
MSELIETILKAKIASAMRVMTSCPDVNFEYLREFLFWAQEKFPNEYKRAHWDLIWSDALSMDNHPRV